MPGAAERNGLSEVDPSRLTLDIGLAGIDRLFLPAFVTPYPPVYPILVPGQVITGNASAIMAALDTREVHGFDPAPGARVFASAWIGAD